DARARSNAKGGDGAPISGFQLAKISVTITVLLLITPIFQLYELASPSEKVIPTMKKSMPVVAAFVAVFLIPCSDAFRCASLAAESPESATGSPRVGQDSKQTQGPSAPKETLDPLEAASRALAQLEKIKSAVATATWEEHFQRPEDIAPAPWTK